MFSKGRWDLLINLSLEGSPAWLELREGESGRWGHGVGNGRKWELSGSSSLAKLSEPLGPLELWSRVGSALLHYKLPG